MLGGLGMPEVLVILLVVLLLFGARRIPEIAGGLGKGISEFKRNMSDAQRQITEMPPAEQRIASERTTEPVVRQDEEARPEPKRLLS